MLIYALEMPLLDLFTYLLYWLGTCCSAYGEAFFLMLQTLVIGILILYYKRGARVGAVYAAVYIGLLSYLMSPTAPLLLVWLMQLSVMPLIATARVGLLRICFVSSVRISVLKQAGVSWQRSYQDRNPLCKTTNPSVFKISL